MRGAADASYKPLRRTDDQWLQRWMRTTAELARLQYSHRMVDAVIEEIDGRRIRDRRPLAGRLRLVQLPRLRPRPGDHRRRRRDGPPVGHAPELVAAARQPAALPGDRGAAHRAARAPRTRWCCRPITHIHMSVIPVLAGRRHDLHGRPRTQDDLRRLPMSPRPRRHACERFRHDDLEHARGAARGGTGARSDAHLHGRRQQHDRQRARPRRLRRAGPRARRAAVRRRRPRLRRDRRALARRAVRRTASGATASSATRRDLRQHRPRRRLLQGLLVAAGVPGLPTALEEDLKIAAPPYLYSGPSPVASLATVLAGFEVNERRGDALRADLHARPSGCSTACTRWASPPRTSRASRSSRSRWRRRRHRRRRRLPLRPRAST